MNDLSLELFDIWYAGKADLPSVAVVYGEAAQQIHTTGLDDAGAFSGGAATGKFATSWANMRNLFQDDILAATATNLTETGNALVKLTAEYAKEDGETAKDFQAQVDDLPNSGLDEPPSYVPDPPTHDDPHPEEQPQPGPGGI